MVEPTSLLLGLEGLAVSAVVRRADRTRVVEVITVDPNASRCPDCGMASDSVKDRTVTNPRDVRYGDDPITLRWNKTRYRCRNQTCSRVSFTEAIPQVPARRRTTTRLRTQIGRCVGDAARSVVEVADGAGVSWPTAHAAFVAHAESVLGDPAPVTVLGIDETRRGKPRWTRDQVSGRWVRTDPWDTGFVDLAGDQGLLGQVEGRTGAVVRQWLGEQNETFRSGVTHGRRPSSAPGRQRRHGTGRVTTNATSTREQFFDPKRILVPPVRSAGVVSIVAYLKYGSTRQWQECMRKKQDTRQVAILQCPGRHCAHAHKSHVN